MKILFLQSNNDNYSVKNSNFKRPEIKQKKHKKMKTLIFNMNIFNII